jgi:hypothetical protein
MLSETGHSTATAASDARTNIVLAEFAAGGMTAPRRHAAMRVSFTIDVPDGGGVARATTLPAFLSAALNGDAAPPLRGLAPDRVERAADTLPPPAGNGLPPLRALMSSLAAIASRRAAHACETYVDHGSLRVPAAADADFRAAVRYLARDSAMRSVIAHVEHSRTEYTLKIIHNGNDRYEPDTHVVAWDPSGALRTTSGGRQSPALGLGHELAHAAVRPWVLDAGSRIHVRAYDNAEERRVIRGAEAHAARTLGEATRADHGGAGYRVASPVTC